MKQIELTSKLVLAIVGLASVSAILIPTYAVPPITSVDIVDNTIQSVDIKIGEVKNSDLGNDAVTSAKITDGTIQSEDIADGVIPDAGSTGQLVVTERNRVANDISPNTVLTIGGLCNSDEVPIGGGFEGFAWEDNVIVAESHRNSAENGWFLALHYVLGSGSRDVRGISECAKLVS